MKEKHAWPVMLLAITLYLQNFIFALSYNIIGPMLDNILKFYEMGVDSGGMMTLFQNVGGLIAVFVLMLVMDRLNKPATIMLPIAVFVASLLLMGLAPQFAIFMLLYGTLGMSMGTMDSLANAIIPDIFVEGRTRALSFLHGAFGLGAIASPIVVSSLLGSELPWDTAYTLAGIVGAVILALYVGAYMLSRKHLAVLRAHTMQHVKKTRIGLFMKDRRVWLIFICGFLFMAYQGGIIVWMTQYLRMEFNAVVQTASLALTFYWIGSTLCRFITGASFMKLKPRTILIGGNLIAGLVLGIGVLSGNMIVLLVSIFLGGLANGSAIPLLVEVICGWYPGNTGLASSITFLSFYISTALVPLGMGYLADRVSMTAAVLVPAVAVFLLGLAAINLPKDEDDALAVPEKGSI
ncbi:MAG: MFS transporter [Christensenellales bacterium]|jgi:fucose permease